MVILQQIKTNRNTDDMNESPEEVFVRPQILAQGINWAQPALWYTETFRKDVENIS